MINSIKISNFLFKTSKKKIFFICNILGLAFACLIIFFFGEKFKSKVIINYPSSFDFLLHGQIKKFVTLESNFFLHEQFKIKFNENLLSNKNLKEFINNNTKYNLLLQGYGDNIKIIKKLTFNLNDGEFFLVFDKSIDGKELFINYIDHIKKKTIKDLLIGYRELILSNIENRKRTLNISEESLKILKIETIEDRGFMQQLYYDIFAARKEIKELESLYNEYDPVKFDYRIYEDLPSVQSYLYYSNYSIIFLGLMLGSVLFLVIIFLNSSAVNKKKIFS